MDLKIHKVYMYIIQGVIFLTVVALGEMRTPNIIELDPEASDCQDICDFGFVCLLHQCEPCSACPDDPFDIDPPSGVLFIYSPCIKYGFCPNVCSAYLRLGDHPRATNKTYCHNAPPKVEPQLSTQPLDEIETTADNSKDEKPTTTVTKEPTPKTDVSKVDNGDGGMTYLYPYLYPIIAVLIVAVGVLLIFKVVKRINCRKQSSSAHDIESLLQATQNGQLLIETDPQNNTATVKGLKVLDYTAVRVCACLYTDPHNSDRNWITLSQDQDELVLTGPMIPHQIYTVQAGTVISTDQFMCKAEDKVNTSEFSNVNLEDECSTTLGDILERHPLRRSLGVELVAHRIVLADIISSVLNLTNDERLVFRSNTDSPDQLQSLSEIVCAKDLGSVSVHDIMAKLVDCKEAKDFIRKIAKRDADTNHYCTKCIMLLHKTCCN